MVASTYRWQNQGKEQAIEICKYHFVSKANLALRYLLGKVPAGLIEHIKTELYICVDIQVVESCAQDDKHEETAKEPDFVLC